MYDDHPYNQRDSYGYEQYPIENRYQPAGPDYGRAPPPPESMSRGPPTSPAIGYKPPVSYKCIAGMVIAVVALIFLFVFMSYPWYSIDYTAKNEGTGVSEELVLTYDLENIESEMKIGNTSYKMSHSYDDVEVRNETKEVKEVMDNTYYLNLISMVFIIIAVALIPIVAIGKLPHSIGMIFLILAIIFILLIPIYFYLSLPPALEKQFDTMWGDDKDSEKFTYNGEFLATGKGDKYDDDDNKIDYEVEWGPGMGFWLIFVPLITLVVGQIAYSMGKDDAHRRRRYGSDDYLGLEPSASASAPPPPPRQDGVRDYGQARPMGREDYDRQAPLRRDHGGYDQSQQRPQRPPPRPSPPRRRGGYDYDQGGRPPPPRRPPRRRYDY